MNSSCSGKQPSSTKYTMRTRDVNSDAVSSALSERFSAASRFLRRASASCSRPQAARTVRAREGARAGGCGAGGECVCGGRRAAGAAPASERSPHLHEPEQNGNMIPFLRNSDDSPNRIKAENLGRSMTRTRIGRSTYKRKHLKRREMSWNNFSKPISKFNESVHLSAKIGFERV